MSQMFSQQSVRHPSVHADSAPLQFECIQYELYATPHCFSDIFSVHICFILEVNPIFECTCATVWRHPRGENCKITTFSRWHCARARWKQQETAREAREIKPFSSQTQVFLECFCLLDLGQACLIITQVLFSARCVFNLHLEGPVNRSGGVRRQVNRGRVFHSA